MNPLLELRHLTPVMISRENPKALSKVKTGSVCQSGNPLTVPKVRNIGTVSQTVLNQLEEDHFFETTSVPFVFNKAQTE